MSIEIFAFRRILFRILYNRKKYSNRSDGKKDGGANANDPFRIGFGRGRKRIVCPARFGQEIGACGRIRLRDQGEKAGKNLGKFGFIFTVLFLASRKALRVRVGKRVGKIVEQDPEAKCVMRGIKPNGEPFFEVLFDRGCRMRETVSDPTVTVSESAQIGEKQKIG